MNNSRRNLKRLLRAITTASGSIPDVSPEPTAITITSEKHGALYNVSSMTIHFQESPDKDFGTMESMGGAAGPGGRKRHTEKCATPEWAAGQDRIEPDINLTSEDHVLTFAINAAILPEQRAFLAVEQRLLRSLFTRFPSSVAGIPRPLLSGSIRLKNGQTDSPLDLFVAEWFRDHHEFHLCARAHGSHDAPLRLHVWKPGQNDLYLDNTRIRELYRGAALILTFYLDTHSFRQIYPWHHAAGDFIVDESVTPVSVKLVTARGYRSLLPGKSNAGDKMLGALHFFVNLTIRMRIDRVEGTGDLAWAGPAAFYGIIRGFAEAWENKERENPEVPGAREIFSFYLGLSPEERLAFAEIAALNGQVETDETEFLATRLTEHVRHLSAALHEFLGESSGQAE